MVTVWWSQHGVTVIHYSSLRSGEAITADVYCAEFRTMVAKLKEKQPRLINRYSPLLLHDNARPHTARNIVFTLQELQLEAIRHPPYSLDLAPTGYHFFVICTIFYVVNSFLHREQYKMPSNRLSNLDHQSSMAKVNDCLLDDHFYLT